MNEMNFQIFQLILINLLWLCKNVRSSSDAFNHPNWPKTAEVCGHSYSDRIIGGQNAALGQYPWIAHLGFISKD